MGTNGWDPAMANAHGSYLVCVDGRAREPGKEEAFDPRSRQCHGRDAHQVVGWEESAALCCLGDSGQGDLGEESHVQIEASLQDLRWFHGWKRMENRQHEDHHHLHSHHHYYYQHHHHDHDHDQNTQDETKRKKDRHQIQIEDQPFLVDQTPQAGFR